MECYIFKNMNAVIMLVPEVAIANADYNMLTVPELTRATSLVADSSVGEPLASLINFTNCQQIKPSRSHRKIVVRSLFLKQLTLYYTVLQILSDIQLLCTIY